MRQCISAVVLNAIAYAKIRLLTYAMRRGRDGRRETDDGTDGQSLDDDGTDYGTDGQSTDDDDGTDDGTNERTEDDDGNGTDTTGRTDEIVPYFSIYFQVFYISLYFLCLHNFT